MKKKHVSYIGKFIEQRIEQLSVWILEDFWFCIRRFYAEAEYSNLVIFVVITNSWHIVKYTKI